MCHRVADDVLSAKFNEFKVELFQHIHRLRKRILETKIDMTGLNETRRKEFVDRKISFWFLTTSGGPPIYEEVKPPRKFPFHVPEEKIDYDKIGPIPDDYIRERFSSFVTELIETTVDLKKLLKKNPVEIEEPHENNRQKTLYGVIDNYWENLRRCRRLGSWKQKTAIANFQESSTYAKLMGQASEEKKGEEEQKIEKDWSDVTSMDGVEEDEQDDVMRKIFQILKMGDIDDKEIKDILAKGDGGGADREQVERKRRPAFTEYAAWATRRTVDEDLEYERRVHHEHQKDSYERTIEEMTKELKQKNKQLQEKDKQLREQEKQIEQLRKLRKRKI